MLAVVKLAVETTVDVALVGRGAGGLEGLLGGLLLLTLLLVAETFLEEESLFPIRQFYFGNNCLSIITPHRYFTQKIIPKKINK